MRKKYRYNNIYIIIYKMDKYIFGLLAFNTLYTIINHSKLNEYNKRQEEEKKIKNYLNINNINNNIDKLNNNVHNINNILENISKIECYSSKLSDSDFSE